MVLERNVFFRWCQEFLCMVIRADVDKETQPECFLLWDGLVLKSVCFHKAWCQRELLAGQMQAQQNASAEQTLTNKVQLMLEELTNENLTRTEIIDKTYVKGGCTPSKDGTMV